MSANLKYLSIALCASALAVACEKAEVEKIDESEPFEISARISPDTKVSMNDQLQLSWDMVNSERMWIVSTDVNHGQCFEIVRVEDGGKKAVFGCSKGDNLEKPDIYKNVLNYNAIVPFTYDPASKWMQSVRLTAGGGLVAYVCDIEETQTILNGNNMDKKYLFMLASGSRASSSEPVPELNFKNAVSLLSFTVTSDNITKMTISVKCDIPQQSDANNFISYLNNQDMIAGPAFVKYQANWAADPDHTFGAYAKYIDGAHTPTYNFDHVNVVCENGAAFEVGKTYYIPIWPGVKTNLTATAYDKDGEVVKTKSVNGTFTCVRSKVHSLGSFGTE